MVTSETYTTPMHPRVLKRGADDFKSLPTREKHSWVTSAIYTCSRYRLRYVQFYRQQKKQSVGYPYLHIKDLMMLGDLDLMEAKQACKKRYIPTSFGVLLQQNRNEELEKIINQLEKSNYLEGAPEVEPQKFAPSYNNEYFVVTKISEFRDVKKETRATLDAEKRKKMLAKDDNESYRKKTEWSMRNWVQWKETITIESEERRKNLPANVEMYQRVMKKAEFNRSDSLFRNKSSPGGKEGAKDEETEFEEINQMELVQKQNSI